MQSFYDKYEKENSNPQNLHTRQNVCQMSHVSDILTIQHRFSFFFLNATWVAMVSSILFYFLDWRKDRGLYPRGLI